MRSLLLLSSFLLILTGSAYAQKNGVAEEFANLEEYPRFPGCAATAGDAEDKEECAEVRMLQHIYSNLKYPDAAKQQNIQGVVTARFTVEASGKVSNPKIQKGIGGGCDEEVIRLINEMPVWDPGKTGGVAQPADYVMSIKFSM